MLRSAFAEKALAQVILREAKPAFSQQHEFLLHFEGHLTGESRVISLLLTVGSPQRSHLCLQEWTFFTHRFTEKDENVGDLSAYLERGLEMTPSSALRRSASSQSSVATQTTESCTLSRRNSLAEAGQGGDALTTLDEKLVKASELLNAKKPREALALLSPSSDHADAKAHYGFQSRLGNAYMGVADELVAANQLGSFLVTPDGTGNWLKPTIHAERISCYLGVLGAYGRFMQILQQPEQRARFIEKNSQEILDQVEEGVRGGIAHAMLEPLILLNRISQINSNKSSQKFVQQSLESGRLTENDPIVRSFREVEADPLYQPIAAATNCIQQVAEEDGRAPQMFWHEWLQKEKEALFWLPEYQLTRSYAA